MSEINQSLKMPANRALHMALGCMRKELARLRFEIGSGCLGWRRVEQARRELNALDAATRVLERSLLAEDGDDGRKHDLYECDLPT